MKRNLSGFLLPICSVRAESAWRCLLSFGFAIKTASILVMKKQACVLLYLLRWRPSHGCYQTQQKGGRESPELVLEQIFQKDASVFCSPPCLHPSPTTTAATLLTSPPEQTDSAPCHSWYYLSGKWGSPLFFANGLICWGMGEGVKGSPNFTGDGFALLSFISN